MVTAVPTSSMVTPSEVPLSPTAATVIELPATPATRAWTMVSSASEGVSRSSSATTAAVASAKVSSATVWAWRRAPRSSASVRSTVPAAQISRPSSSTGQLAHVGGTSPHAGGGAGGEVCAAIIGTLVGRSLAMGLPQCPAWAELLLWAEAELWSAGRGLRGLPRLRVLGLPLGPVLGPGVDAERDIGEREGGADEALEGDGQVGLGELLDELVGHGLVEPGEDLADGLRGAGRHAAVDDVLDGLDRLLDGALDLGEAA